MPVLVVLGLLNFVSPLRASESSSRIAEQITALYAEHNPSKLDAVPGLLRKYAGHEEELLETIKEKYNAKQSLPPPKKAAGRKSKRATKARAGKAATAGSTGMREAAEAGQQLVQAMSARGRIDDAEALVDQVVAAYTLAAEDPRANQTEAWERIGYYQRGYYQEMEKKLKLQDGRPADSAAMARLRALGRHRSGAFSAYRHLVDDVNPRCMQGWEGLASVHDDMAAAGQASWPDSVATYHEAIRHHPTWVRGVRRAAEIILSEHGVADSPTAPYSYSDALSVMDALIDRIIAEPDYFGRSCSTKYGGPVQCQFLNLQWIYGSSELSWNVSRILRLMVLPSREPIACAASRVPCLVTDSSVRWLASVLAVSDCLSIAVALHAERGNLSRALAIEGLACKFYGCDPGGGLRLLNAAEILPHYNVPLAPIPSSGVHNIGFRVLLALKHCC